LSLLFRYTNSYENYSMLFRKIGYLYLTPVLRIFDLPLSTLVERRIKGETYLKIQHLLQMA